MTEITKLRTFDYAGYIQFDVKAGDPAANLATITEELAQLAPDFSEASSSLVVLPELWATGFAYSALPALAAQTPDLLAALQELADRYQTCLAGSLPEKDTSGNNTRYYNTLYITGPTGTTVSYRKQRLFAPMREDSFFTPGKNNGPLDTLAGPVAALVCYDLRFPELTRTQTATGANLLIIAAQWPMARLDHWQTLVQARAIENQVFVVAANRCGTTGSTDFAGHSMIVAPDGSILRDAGKMAQTAGTKLDHTLLSSVRGRFNTVTT